MVREARFLFCKLELYYYEQNTRSTENILEKFPFRGSLISTGKYTEFLTKKDLATL